MKVYTECSKCKHEISFWTWSSDRIEFIKSKGKSIKLTCGKCNWTDNYEINNLKAKESKLFHFIGMLIFFIGTLFLYLFLRDYLFKINYVFGILGLVIPLIIPYLIFGTITKNDRERVNNFNRS
jgi:hypothetical protein